MHINFGVKISFQHAVWSFPTSSHSGRPSDWKRKLLFQVFNLWHWIAERKWGKRSLQNCHSFPTHQFDLTYQIAMLWKCEQNIRVHFTKYFVSPAQFNHSGVQWFAPNVHRTLIRKCLHVNAHVVCFMKPFNRQNCDLHWRWFCIGKSSVRIIYTPN